MKRSIDPSSTDYRLCAFCGEEFMTNHGTRQFCPQKFGKANYCKQKYAQALKEYKLVNSIDQGDGAVFYDNSIASNIRILDELSKGTERDLSLAEFNRYNFMLTHYEGRMPIMDTGLYQISIGKYILTWISEDIIRLTIKK